MARRKNADAQFAIVDEAKLAELRMIGREALDSWQRIAAADPNAVSWAQQLSTVLDGKAIRSLIAEYRQLADDSALDSSDRAEAKLRVDALATLLTKGRKKRRR